MTAPRNPLLDSVTTTMIIISIISIYYSHYISLLLLVYYYQSAGVQVLVVSSPGSNDSASGTWPGEDAGPPRDSDSLRQEHQYIYI